MKAVSAGGLEAQMGWNRWWTRNASWLEVQVGRSAGGLEAQVGSKHMQAARAGPSVLEVQTGWKSM